MDFSLGPIAASVTRATIESGKTISVMGTAGVVLSPRPTRTSFRNGSHRRHERHEDLIATSHGLAKRASRSGLTQLDVEPGS